MALYGVHSVYLWAVVRTTKEGFELADKGLIDSNGYLQPDLSEKIKARRS